MIIIIIHSIIRKTHILIIRHIIRRDGTGKEDKTKQHKKNTIQKHNKQLNKNNTHHLI